MLFRSLFQVVLSPCLIFGIGPFPALGIAGGGVANVLTSALTAAVLGWYILSGRSLVRLRLVRLRWVLFHDILRVGGVQSGPKNPQGVFPRRVYRGHGVNSGKSRMHATTFVASSSTTSIR